MALSVTSGRLDFNTAIPGDTLVQGFTDANGFYAPGFPGAVAGYRGLAANQSISTDYSSQYKWATVRDRETGIYIQLLAPGDVRIVTPVTSLLVSGALTQAKLKTQLGINGSVFGLSADPDLRTYDPLAELASGDAVRSSDGAHLLAAHVRSMAIAFGGFEGMRLRAAPRSNEVTVNWLNVSWGGVGNCLAAAPSQFIFSNTEMAAVLKCGGTADRATLSDAAYSAMAHLVDAYAAAIPVKLDDPSAAARWTLGIRGYLMPAIAALAANPSPSAISDALAVNTQTIFDETVRYADHFVTPTDGIFFAGPDFAITSAGTTVSIPLNTLRANDTRYQGTDGGMVSDGTIQSVSVASANAGQLSAQLAGSDVILTPAAGFRGVTYADYVTRGTDGTSRTARIYLRVV